MKYALFLAIIVVFQIPCFAQTAAIEKAKPFSIGEVYKMRSSILNEERTLNIYFPDGYSANDTTRYPVIYLLDGSAEEDFIHIVGLVQFNSFEWVNRLPKSIVVGIANIDRMRDFTFPASNDKQKKKFPSSGHSDKFISFLEMELQPFVRENFRVNGDKTIIGESLGGLVATEILFGKTALFNKYIIVSPSLWWDNGSLLDREIGTLENTTVYVGVGKEGLTPTEQPRVMEVDANMLAEKLEKKKGKHTVVYFDYLPAENHATILHQAVYNAFRFFAQH